MPATIDIRKPLKKFLPHLLQAQEENLNEANTVVRLIKFFEEVLGYNAMTEIGREMAIRDKFVDLAIKIDGVVQFLIEAKSAGISLRDKFIDQAKLYASEANIEWVVLTNGVQWYIYHLTFEEGIAYDRIVTVDLKTDTNDQAAAALALLHRRNVAADGLQDFWDHKVALSPGSIGQVLFHEDVITVMRRELRKLIGGKVEEEDFARALHSMLSVEAREQIGPFKIRRKRKARTSTRKGDVAAGPVEEPVIEESVVDESVADIEV